MLEFLFEIVWFLYLKSNVINILLLKAYSAKNRDKHIYVVQQSPNSLNNNASIMLNSFNDCDLSYPLPALVKANEYSFISGLRTNIKPHTTQGTVNMSIFL